MKTIRGGWLDGMREREREGVLSVRNLEQCPLCVSLSLMLCHDISIA